MASLSLDNDIVRRGYLNVVRNPKDGVVGYGGYMICEYIDTTPSQVDLYTVLIINLSTNHAQCTYNNYCQGI